MNRSDFQDIVALIEPEVTDPDNRRAFVETALYGCGVLRTIDWDGPQDVFAFNLVTGLMDYGSCEPGKPSLIMLLEAMKEDKGFDYQQKIDALINIIKADPITAQEAHIPLDPTTPQRPNWTLRLGIGLVIMLVVAVIGFLLRPMISPLIIPITPSVDVSASPAFTPSMSMPVVEEGSVTQRPSAQPPIMTRAFNIALAEFQTSQFSSASERTKIEDAAANIRQTLFSMLSIEYANNDDVQIEIKNMGVVTGIDDAAQLATKTHAHMVIYGQLQYTNGQYIWTPFFYISGRFDADIQELMGENAFGQTILDEASLARLILPNSAEHKRLDDQNKLLVEFTKALTYVAAEQVSNAIAPIQRAIILADDYGEPIGKQVVYLTASGIMRMNGDLEKALEYANASLSEDPDHPYGRAYIALGNVYYERGLQALDSNDYATALTELTRALDWYRDASELTGQTDVFLKEKAHEGMGNIYISLYQVPGLARPELAQKSLDAYRYVINSYNRAIATGNPRAPYLAQLAREASFSSGVVQSWLGRSNEAIVSFNFVLSMTAAPSLKETVQANIELVQTQAAMQTVTPTSQP